ncbi:Nitroreductase [Abditibacterium utsteinense]|uniref:Nitroreductase n=1 Tax=Abditibacterium utsteinense TaxID=1960156 RepID=A0A2S8SR77_9BACT|nr:nitroreductase family protein [Abditibacterium utsteinense]PQV63297.1 Nitroreductase [Abditibacterium utsteinense]
MELLPEVKLNRVPEYPVDNAFLNRWSPRAFSARSVTDEVLGNIFEAARWAASSYNEQPWRFLVAKTDTDRKTFQSFLLPANFVWAKEAPVLVLTLGKKTFTHNGTANRVFAHDVGAASAYMALAATQNGLHAHGMAGFDPELARATLAIPTDYEPMAMWALGYAGDAAQLPENYRALEFPSQRRPLSEIVMEGAFHEVPADNTQQK